MAKAKQNLSLKDAIVEAIKQKKGRDIVVIDLTGNEQAIADYYIICHGNSTSQVDALAGRLQARGYGLGLGEGLGRELALHGLDHDVTALAIAVLDRGDVLVQIEHIDELLKK